MKKIKNYLSIVLLAALLLCFVSCESKDKKAFSISKEAYDKLTEAYDLVDQYSSAIYNAWMAGIYDEDELSISHLANETGLSTSDLYDALPYLVLEDEYETATPEKKAEYKTDLTFTLLLIIYEQDFSLCTNLVNAAYKISGRSTEISTLLSESKLLLRSLSEENSDYEHYPNLKNLYTTVNAFFEYCESPSGSFEQSKTTINDYRNEARNYINDLEFIFED